MMRQKILLLGSAGFLGGEIAATAPPGVELWSAYYKSRPAGGNAVQVDVVDYPALVQVLQRVQPTAVIHAARIHPVDNDPVLASRATEKIVEAVNVIGAVLVYISSDAVFDGQKGNYREDDTPNPVTNYGKAKLAAEVAIQQHCRRFIIIRTSYIYGKSIGQWDKRTAELMQRVNAGHEAKYFQDMYRSPTCVNDLARACWQLLGKKFLGVIHVAGARKSIFDFSQEVAQGIDLDAAFIKPDSIKNSPQVIAPDTSLKY